MAEVLVTGGTGFVGGAILRRLLAEGRSVRALVRSGEGAAAVSALGAEPAFGDVLNPGSLRDAADGCEIVFHAAGVNEVCGRDPGRMERVNLDGSVAMVWAAAEAGVRRVVYTSSAAAVGEAAGVTATEDTPFSGSDVTAYAASKRRAEAAVLAEAHRRGIEVVSVNPSSVQGPGRTSGTARILIGSLRGRLRVAVDTVVSLVFVDDCTDAHLLAAERGSPGERYLVSGATLSVREALEVLGRVAGRRRRVVFLPRAAVSAAAPLVGAGFRLLRKHPPLCREAGRVVRHGARYDGSRISRDLGLDYTPVEEWLERTVAWYRSQGLL